MKSKVTHVMPFRDWVVRFPELAKDIKNNAPALYNVFACDPLYVVRMSYKGIEIGYKEDTWKLV